MPSKTYILDFEPGEMTPSKSMVPPSPCRTPTKILDSFSDAAPPNNALIECQRMKMIVNQQKAEIAKLKLQSEREIDQLRVQLQSERSATNAQIMELEDKVSDLLACNRQLRAEIAYGGDSSSPESSIIHLNPPPVKRGILPSRWTRSQPNLKQPIKAKSMSTFAPISSVTEDSIDFLDSQVSDLAVESLVKAMESRPKQLDLKPHELRDMNYSDTESIESPMDSPIDMDMLYEPSMPAIEVQKTPRKSRFIEDFSFENESTNIIDKSHRWSDPGIDLSVRNPIPQYESTFIGEQQQPQHKAEPAPTPKAQHKLETPPVATIRPLVETSLNVPIKISPGKKIHISSPMPVSAPPPPSPTKPIYKMVSQVFLGEMLHKSTRGFRKTEQHERYFWIHPYSLTLYWDKENPSASKGAHQPKSVPITGVSEEIDMNMGPGLYHKSILIKSGKRDIKLTCSNPTRHDVWMKSIRYLLAGAGK